jgi:hypothetical protein
MFPSMLSQGDQGEGFAIGWLMAQGWTTAMPIGNCSDYDALADIDGRIVRVQVKTSRYFRNNRWGVSLITAGGNQSWTGVVKRFTPDRYDYLYAHVADGRRWFIPSHAIEGSRGILLGGPKYAEYEVDPGHPLTLS